jgi:hypothetical protein
MYISLLIITLVLFSLLNYYSHSSIVQIKEPRFLSAKETSSFLEDDRDGFVNSLNKINLIARNSNSPQEYIKYISSQTLNYSERQKKVIVNSYFNVYNILFANINKLKNYGINKENLKEVFASHNVRFALTKEKHYEYGMPHTRNNVIFLSTFYLNKYAKSPSKIIKTIIHEIIHIYQRFYRNSYNNYLISKGWSPINTEKYPKKRFNPDLDFRVWKRRGKLYLVEFKDNPKHLEDIIVLDSLSTNEHPYEYYAYKISNLITF